MATFGKEVEAIVSLVGEVNSSIQRIGAGWFSSRKEIEVYQVRARSLRDRLGTWSGLVQAHGLDDHQVVKPVLELANTAMKSLDKEAAYLKEMRHSCCMRYKSSLLRSVFPRDLSPKLKSMGNAFQTLEVPALMEELMISTRLLEANHGSKPARLPFCRDARYFPIQNTVDEVVEALEKIDGPHVVTLSGGAGTGKTALVRALALAYQEHHEKGKALIAVDLSNGGGTKFFHNGVVYIACGVEADSKVKIVELLHSLGSCSQVPTEDDDESQSHTEDILRKRLCACLEEQDFLVVLDDVWESEFLQRLLVPGKKVKYLVTTQDSGLRTGDYSSHNIVMEKPERQEAESIFLNHIVDSPDDIMSSTVQEAVDKMVREAEDNPLVLKNLAVAISGVKSTGFDVAHWDSVLKKFQDLMAGHDGRNGMMDYDGEHRSDVLCSFELAMDSTPVEAQHLLLLAAHCEGPFVPEVVLSLFHRSTSKGPLNSFSNWTNYVENRDFIKLQDYEVPWSKSQKRIWSIQSLQYCSRKIAKSEEEMNMLSTSLLADNPQANPLGSGDYSSYVDDTLVAALCFVYGEKNMSAKAAIKLTIMTPTQGRGLLRLAVEPVVWLLHVDHEIEEEWEQKAYWSARAVLIKYISEGRLDDEGASTLLSIPESAPAMCKMLQTIGETGERSILSPDTPQTMQSLLKLLLRDVDKSFELQRRATNTLSSLADKSARVILSDPCVLERLMKLLPKDVKPPGQAGAVLALGKLAVTDEIRLKIATYPGILPKLVELLDQNNDCQVQENAAFALARLALNPQNVPRILEHQGTLKKLSFLLSMGASSALQVQAARALANLARVEKVTHRITGYSGIMNAIVRLLEGEVCSALRLQASRLLVNLSACQENHSAICNHPGAIRAVIALLKPEPTGSSCDNPHSVTVVENAAKVLANLSSSKDCRTTIVGTPGGLKHLLALAGNEAHPELQKHAVKCLANLASTALEADRSRACGSSSSSLITLSPEERQALSDLVTSNGNSAANSHRHDLPNEERSARGSARSLNHDDRGKSWSVTRLIKNRWCKMMRFPFRASPRRLQSTVRAPSSSLPLGSPRGGVIEVQLPPAPAVLKSYNINGELEPSLSMKDRVTGPSSFRSPER